MRFPRLCDRADLQRTLRSAESASAKLAVMTDNANRVLGSMPRLMTLTEDVLQDTKVVMQDLRKTTGRLPDLTRNLGTLSEIERLVLGLQKHWLVRGYIEPAEAPGRISPEEIEAGRKRP